MAFWLFHSSKIRYYLIWSLGQENDYMYHKDIKKREDSRYLHRGKFQWDLAKQRKETGSVQQKLFDSISKLEKIRQSYSVFGNDADVFTIETEDSSILGIVRLKGNMFYKKS